MYLDLATTSISVLPQRFVEQIGAGSRRLPVRASRRRKGWN
jgi:hypothetical protein